MEQRRDGPPVDSAREMNRRVSGNELKIMIAIWYLERSHMPRTADAIAEWARLNRATVYRALQRLHTDQYTERSLTAKSKPAVYDLHPITECYIMDIIGRFTEAVNMLRGFSQPEDCAQSAGHEGD